MRKQIYWFFLIEISRTKPVFYLRFKTLIKFYSIYPFLQVQTASCSCSESTPRPAATTKCSAVSWRGDTPSEGATSPGIPFPRFHTSTTPMPSFKQVSVSHFYLKYRFNICCFFMIIKTKLKQASVSLWFLNLVYITCYYCLGEIFNF